MPLLLLVVLYANGCDPRPKSDVEATPRIVTTTPALASFVLALGESNSLVGVSDDTRLEGLSPSVQRIGAFSTFSIEQVSRLHPSHVLLQRFEAQKAASLEQLGISTHSYRLETWPDLVTTTRALGDLLGRPEAAKQWIAALEEAERARPSQSLGLALVVVDADLNQFSRFYIAQGRAVVAELVSHCGYDIAELSKASYAPIGPEALVRFDPDIIVFFAPADADIKAQKAAWQKRKLFDRSPPIVVITHPLYSVPAPQLAQLQHAFCEEIAAQRTAP